MEKEDIEKVIKEFRLLVSPFEEQTDFSIYVSAKEFDLYELRLKNNILKQRYARVEATLTRHKEDRSVSVFSATYEDRVGTNKKFPDEISNKYICGNLQITLYYFLRDSSLKFDGLKANEAKEVLNTFVGLKFTEMDSECALMGKKEMTGFY